MFAVLYVQDTHENISLDWLEVKIYYLRHKQMLNFRNVLLP